MKVIVHFKKDHYIYINNTKKAVNIQIVRNVELIINDKNLLIMDINDGSSTIYDQKIVKGIVVKDER